MSAVVRARACGRPSDSRAARAGFSLIELLVVLVTISLLAGIALPNFQRAILKARAANAAGDLNAVKVGVLNYQANHHTWPEDESRGEIPDGLAAYLPDGFSFEQDEYTLDYDNWTGQTPGIIAVTLISDNRDLGLAVLDVLGPNSWTNGTDKYTLVIEWID